MKAIKAFFDGHDVKLAEPPPSGGKTEVLVVFPDYSKKVSPQEARRLLRGSGRGEGLVKKLLRSRAEDMTLDGE
jgi:hypothetical protein